MNKRSEIQAILTEIQDTTYADVQSPDILLEYGFKLASYLSFSGEAMAEAKKILHDARRAAYLKVEGSTQAQARKWNVTLIKNYVDDSCANENEYYTLCDRCNSACVHTLDLIRSAISYLKSERFAAGFSTAQ